jgi:hypothetical protein
MKLFSASLAMVTVLLRFVRKMIKRAIPFLNIPLLAAVLFISIFSACSNSSERAIEQNDGVTVRVEKTKHSRNQTEGKRRNLDYVPPFHMKALLASRFNSLEHFKSEVSIEYFNVPKSPDGSTENSSVLLSYTQDGHVLKSVLEAGVSQRDISEAKEGSVWDKVGLMFQSPYSIRNRKILRDIYILARWRAFSFGEGDVAFFDLAETAVKKINSPKTAFKTEKDSSEKGYLNSFNHITAQAFITTIHSEDIADFIADVHERKTMPELTTGKFTLKQLNDPTTYPVDNYVDMLNNEIGQELGKQLRTKYNITSTTKWTPMLLADYLNDLQAYYSWAFGIGLDPYRSDDALVIRFTDKLNTVLEGMTLKTARF